MLLVLSYGDFIVFLSILLKCYFFVSKTRGKKLHDKSCTNNQPRLVMTKISQISIHLHTKKRGTIL